MKKILSVLLAVMMLFGALSLSSSAALVNEADALAAVREVTGGSTAVNGNPYVVICYMIGEGTYGEPVQVYESNGFVNSENPGAYYYRIPTTSNELYIGDKNFRPYSVVAPEGKDFDYWYCVENGQPYHPTLHYEITEDMVNANNVITLRASYSVAAGTEDTMSMIMGILIKVFGTIVGFLFFNGQTEAGIEVLEKMIGGLF